MGAPTKIQASNASKATRRPGARRDAWLSPNSILDAFACPPVTMNPSTLLPLREVRLPQREAPLPQREAPLPQREAPLPLRKAPLPLRKAPLPLRETRFPTTRRATLETLQVNLGYRCNLSCAHCHVNAGPHRTESMAPETIDLVIRALRELRLRQLDLTGGAPELHPEFRRLVERAVALGVTVTDRCNLTVLDEPGQQGLAEFLASRGVTIVASLPCYEESNVKAQRGQHVYERSIAALRRLNALGYGQPGKLELHLVYNPVGAALPPPQATLEQRYRDELHGRFGIVFTSLYTITNMPIGRFARVLAAKGEHDAYMQLLLDNFNTDTLDGLMCRRLASVDWRGRLYDCDFNQMLGLSMPGMPNMPGMPGMPSAGSAPRDAQLGDLLAATLEGREIATGAHCFGCTAGAGSSCGGTLS